MTNEQKTKVAYASFFALKMKTHNYTIGETVGKILNIMGIDTQHARRVDLLP
jgi:hypothetical protein